MKYLGIGLLVLILIIGAYFFSVYNGLVTRQESINGQWAQVETQYQRRFDLIPNLVSTVQGIMNQEREIFGQIAEARTRYGQAGSVDEKVEAAGELDSALGRLLVVMENYPTLRSSENVQTVLVQLEGTENRISVERGRFNDQVRDYNAVVKRMPTSLVASLFGFDERPYFESVDAAAEAPKVEFE